MSNTIVTFVPFVDHDTAVRDCLHSLAKVFPDMGDMTLHMLTDKLLSPVITVDDRYALMSYTRAADLCVDHGLSFFLHRGVNNDELGELVRDYGKRRALPRGVHLFVAQDNPEYYGGGLVVVSIPDEDVLFYYQDWYDVAACRLSEGKRTHQEQVSLQSAVFACNQRLAHMQSIFEAFVPNETLALYGEYFHSQVKEVKHVADRPCSQA